MAAEPDNGRAGRLALWLAVITVAISAVSAIPPFLALRGKSAYVVFDAVGSQVQYPSAADRVRVTKLLAENKLPDATATLRISNRGDEPAREVVATGDIPGTIVTIATDPVAESNPAWVIPSITRDSALPGRVRIRLESLGLERTLAATIAYTSTSTEPPLWDVFFDGKPAIRTQSIDALPLNMRKISFLPAFRILAIGFSIAFAVYLAAKMWSSGQLRDVRRAIGSLSGHEAWYRYKSDVMFELFTRGNVVSIADGVFDAQDPRAFWDGVMRINDVTVALDIHTTKQHWPAVSGTVSECRRFALGLLTMAGNTTLLVDVIACINDKDCWSEDSGKQFIATVHELLRGRDTPKVVFLSGDAPTVAMAATSAVGRINRALVDTDAAERPPGGA